ncbi:winged helix-turn-helix transcriptional regulator [Yoonia maritima]|uniref:winged helix-turn-helix transcriptional regulator n=1 Tax=Yoonia maritima TaxID=1435347 RepID=UPI000D0F21C1|nr:helix-turn-helix domain-containing protein [Yoonia maritima]
MPKDSAETKYFTVDCPNRLLFAEIADKWSMMILSVLDTGPHRFNGIKRCLEGVSQKSLTQTLRKLERNGIISRTVRSTSPVAVEYAMTPLGMSLLGPYRAIYTWTCVNLSEVNAARLEYDGRQT